MTSALRRRVPTAAAGFALAALFVSQARADIPSVLTDALKSTTQAKSYHFDLLHGSTHIGAGDYASPGRYRTSTLGMEMVVMPAAYYMRRGSGKWHKFPAVGNNMADVMKTFSDERKNFTSTDLGMRDAGGQSMHAYTLQNVKRHSTQTIYIDNGGHIGRVEAKQLVITFSRYDEPVTIAAPL